MTFDSSLHEYRDGETVIPSVMQILAAAGEIDVRWFTAEARERGHAVHSLCQKYANGERFDAIGRELASLEYVNALAAWFRERHAYAIATEQMINGMVNGRRYAGTFDLLAEIDGKRCLIDYKTGAGLKWHPAQIAAYALAVNPDRCIMLHLKADGRYREAVIQGFDLLSGLSTFKDAINKAA
jgi:hypothetical protein